MVLLIRTTTQQLWILLTAFDNPVGMRTAHGPTSHKVTGRVHGLLHTINTKMNLYRRRDVPTCTSWGPL